MDTMYIWMPTLLTMTIFGCFFGITFSLYWRWKSANYFYCSLATGGSFLIHAILFVVALKGGSQLVHTLGLLTANLTIIGTTTALLYFFHSREPKKKELIISGAFAALALICAGGTLFHFNGALSASMLVTVGYVIYGVLFIIPHLPRQKLFLQWMNGLFGAASLLYLGSWFIHYSIVLFLANLMVTATAAFLLMIFYTRIVDMVEAVSISAVTDGMTGLFNKKHFITKVTEALHQQKGYAVIFSDIDNFKRLNDTQGHAVGDDILKLVARTMKETFKTSGYVGRYGGEEMVAVVNSKKADAFALAELFRSRVEEITPSISPVTVSVGVSLLTSGEEITAMEFIKQADIAMYSAKTNGKNRVVLYKDKDDNNQEDFELTPLKTVSEGHNSPAKSELVNLSVKNEQALETMSGEIQVAGDKEPIMARREEFTPVAVTSETAVTHDEMLYEEVAAEPVQPNSDVIKAKTKPESSQVIKAKTEPKAPNPFKKAIRANAESPVPAQKALIAPTSESKSSNPFILPEQVEDERAKMIDKPDLKNSKDDEPGKNGSTKIESFMDKIK